MYEQKHNSREKTKPIAGYGSFLLLHMVWGKNSWTHWVKPICSKQAPISPADLVATRSLGLKSWDFWGEQIINPHELHKRKKPHKTTTKKIEKWDVVLSLKGGRRILLVNPNPAAGTRVEKPHSPLTLPKPLRDCNTNHQECFNWMSFCKGMSIC